MPRPKRSKIAPSAPIKLHYERVPQPAVAVAMARKNKDLFSPASSARVNTTSDDSDGLVVAKKTRRNVTSDARQMYRMSGALALEDIGDTRLKPPSSKTRAELNRIAREKDHVRAAEKIGPGIPAAQVAETEDPEQIPSSIPTEPASTEKSSSSSSSRKPLARQPTLGRLGSRAHETPRMQPSMLGGAAFKGRPRQPSLLQMAQSQNQTQVENDDDMYDFLPDDESTPLIKTLSHPRAQHRSPSSGQTSGSRKRKQMTPEIQVPASQSQSTLPRSSPSSSPPPSLEQEEIHETPAENHQPQPSLPRHRSTQEPQSIIFSDTLAPPQSSSPAKPKPTTAHIKPIKAPRKGKPKAQLAKQKTTSPAASPLSSPSTRNSPIRPNKTKPLTTATLQNLLPRRRARGRPKGDYDMPSSSDIELDNTGLGEDEDELSYHAAKVPQKKSGMTIPKSAGKRKEGTATKKPKTYARKSVMTSDNDNEDDENESVSWDLEGDEIVGAARKRFPALDGKAKAEMKRLADKFREVDEYTLDFEDMTGTSSSQMKDAR